MVLTEPFFLVFGIAGTAARTGNRPLAFDRRGRKYPSLGVAIVREGSSTMAWKLEGSYFETCSCEVVCPCTTSLSLGADYDRCKATLVFNIARGDVEGTDVGGLKVAAIADTPKVMSEGNWRLGVFIDSAASDEQAEKLAAVFGGQLGGPMEALGPLVSENLGVERVVPFGVESGEPARLTGIFHPAGSELTISKATRSRINAFGIEYEGKSGFSSSKFAWAA